MENITDKLNRPIRDLRISVIDTCNYRCHYCMPAEKFDEKYQFLRPNQRLSFSEIIRVVKIFAQFGVNKIRLTGGEPLLRKNLPQLISEIKKIRGIKDIALTTNGQLLKRHLPQLIDAGLDRINISLDTVDEVLYHHMSGNKGDLKTVLEAIDLAETSQLKSVKINCVVQKGINDQYIIPLLDRFKNSNVVVRFIEFMDVGTKNGWQENNVLPFKELHKMINQKWIINALDANYKGEVANRYKYKNHKGEIGFINSISQPFCQDCSRARLSVDGKLYTCLFANQSFDLKTHLSHNDDEFLKQQIKNIWHNREDRYSEIRHTLEGKDNDRIEMYVIGG